SADNFVMFAELPIIQAPMAGVQTAALAIAVSKAGGVGSLPCAMLSAEAIHRELSAIRAQTDKAYNVNFFCHTTADPDASRERAWRAALTPYYEEFAVEPPSTPPPGRVPFDADAASILEAVRVPIVS